MGEIFHQGSCLGEIKMDSRCWLFHAHASRCPRAPSQRDAPPPGFHGAAGVFQRWRASPPMRFRGCRSAVETLVQKGGGRNCASGRAKSPKFRGQFQKSRILCRKALKIAFAYDGEQHFKFPNGFHKSQEAFEKLQADDAKKTLLCEQHGIKLYRVPCGVKFKALPRQYQQG